MNSSDQLTAILKLPLIGQLYIKCFDIFADKDEKGNVKGPISIEMPPGMVDSDLFKKLESALGDYLWDSKGYEKTLDLLFPGVEAFDKDGCEKIVINGDIGDKPLFTRVFAQKYSDNTENLEPLISAGAKLMLELGEFMLDREIEHFHRRLRKELPYTYHFTKEDYKDYHTFNAQFNEPENLLDKIWERILGKDTVVVFIDDDPGFIVKCGINEKDESNGNDKRSEIKHLNDEPPIEKPLGIKCLLDVGAEYKENEVKNAIDRIIKEFKDITQDDKKLVFVVDLLYKKDKIDRIEGTELIRYVRGQTGITPLIIAFTGGQSPFIINSASKAGADIVIMKDRGKTKTSQQDHSVGCTGGLFDLLWALSKNISRRRFLDVHKKYLNDEYKKGSVDYKPVIPKLFYSIENESPYWRDYLTQWVRDVEGMRYSSILFNRKKT